MNKKLRKMREHMAKIDDILAEISEGVPKLKQEIAEVLDRARGPNHKAGDKTQQPSPRSLGIKPCPFCGAELAHIESWAMSFNPPRLYHELHHPIDDHCYLNWLRQRFSDDEEVMSAWIEKWNRRADTP